ncbi:MAG: RraA family protein [Alphaproteobacteria bacterium]|nr:MAG: RraA family protein [Alphaproteobacteria bacterium]
MSITVHEPEIADVSAETIAALKELPVAIIGDELNRAQMMHAAIKPVARGSRFAGRALTVHCMVGDNLALHHAASIAAPGQVIVADGRSHEDTALWGGILHEAATKRGVVAVVIDGAVRDVAELRDSPVPAYARAVVPAGPHKGFGGEVNGMIQCGGTAVQPGDILVGDDDGVVVIRPEQLAGLVERCRERIANEDKILAGIAEGKTTVELLGL